MIDKHLLGAVDVYVSSDPNTNPSGTSWLSNIESNLLNASVLLMIVSPMSVGKPWINIEAGAAWIRVLQARDGALSPVFIMPLCHSGLTPSALPLPWSTFNAVEIRTIGALQQVLKVVAQAAGIRPPSPDLSSTAVSIIELEKKYTVYREVERHLRTIISILGPGVAPVLTTMPPPGRWWNIPSIPFSTVNSVEPLLQWLASRSHIEFQKTDFKITGGLDGTHQTMTILIRPTASFLANLLPHLAL